MITILKDEAFRGAVLNAIQGATREILITTFKMDYTGKISTRHLNAVVQALHRATMRGVRVNVLLNMDNPVRIIGRINRRAGEIMSQQRIRVRYAPQGRSYHAKIIVVDGCLAFVGSHNLSESSLCRNFEVSLMVTQSGRDQSFGDNYAQPIQDLRQIFLKEWEKGR